MQLHENDIGAWEMVANNLVSDRAKTYGARLSFNGLKTSAHQK